MQMCVEEQRKRSKWLHAGSISEEDPMNPNRWIALSPGTTCKSLLKSLVVLAIAGTDLQHGATSSPQNRAVRQTTQAEAAAIVGALTSLMGDSMSEMEEVQELLRIQAAVEKASGHDGPTGDFEDRHTGRVSFPSYNAKEFFKEPAKVAMKEMQQAAVQVLEVSLGLYVYHSDINLSTVTRTD